MKIKMRNCIRFADTRRPRLCNYKLQVKVSRLVSLDSLPGCKVSWLWGSKIELQMAPGTVKIDPWRVPGASWRHLGSSGGLLGSLARVLGGSRSPLGGVLEPLGAILELSCRLSGSF